MYASRFTSSFLTHIHIHTYIYIYTYTCTYILCMRWAFVGQSYETMTAVMHILRRASCRLYACDELSLTTAYCRQSVCVSFCCLCTSFQNRLARQTNRFAPDESPCARNKCNALRTLGSEAIPFVSSGGRDAPVDYVYMLLCFLVQYLGPAVSGFMHAY